MEIKSNDATYNRPKGSRAIDAPYLYSNLNAYIDQVKDESAWEKSDRNAITIFKSSGMTIVLCALKDSATIKDNTTNSFLSIQVLDGKIEMETLDGNIKMEKNQLMVFHPDIPHSVEAFQDSVLLITTYNCESPISHEH